MTDKILQLAMHELFSNNILLLYNSDGAAALVLMSGQKALELGLEVIAKISGYGDAAQVLELCTSKQLSLRVFSSNF